MTRLEELTLEINAIRKELEETPDPVKEEKLQNLLESLKSLQTEGKVILKG